MTMRRLLTLTFLTLALAISAVASAKGDSREFGALYVFGDSLSDPGNVFVLTGTTAVAPFDPIPGAPYAGSLRFTNGKTWVERLARRLGLPKGGRPAFLQPGRFGNYALGGSRAGPSDSPLFTLAGQIDAFLADKYGKARTNALYVIWLGSNDIRAALTAATSDPTFATSQAIIAAAVEAEAQGISRLYAAGARKFLILNAPNVALAPAVTSQGPQAVAAALLLSDGFNSALDGALDTLEVSLPGIEIYRYDVFALLSDIVANPSDYRFRNTMDPCLQFFVIEDVVCQQPNRFLFWDAIHPTRSTHRLLAKEVSEFLRAR